MEHLPIHVSIIIMKNDGKQIYKRTREERKLTQFSVSKLAQLLQKVHGHLHRHAVHQDIVPNQETEKPDGHSVCG